VFWEKENIEKERSKKKKQTTTINNTHAHTTEKKTRE
jgi:hypothetical protein